MKRFLLVIVVLLLAGTMVFAQAGGASPPTSAQTTQSAQQLLTEGRSNSSQFEATLAQLMADNTSNDDANSFSRLRIEISRLESSINSEQNRIAGILNGGNKVSPELLARVERLMNQHKAKLAELETFVSR